MIRLVSWNVNGLRAVMTKGFEETFKGLDADFFCLQETKMQQGQLNLEFDGYESFWNFALKKGYSGTAIFTRRKDILSVTYGMGKEGFDEEGRIINLETEDFILVNVYVPNSQDGLARLDYRMLWEDNFRMHVCGLARQKPVIICGDLNVAHNEIDLKNPSSNHFSAGFTDQEREKMSVLLSSGFTDTFRYFYPDKAGMYSYWSYRMGARSRNAGWRIDYFLTSNANLGREQDLSPRLADARIHTDIVGSDHCPVSLCLN